MPESTLLIVWRGESPGRSGSVKRRDAIVDPRNPKDLPKFQLAGSTRRTAVGLILGAPLLSACAGVQQSLSSFSNPFSSSQPEAAPGPAGKQQQPQAFGN